jgi:hypothetical protein
MSPPPQLGTGPSKSVLKLSENVQPEFMNSSMASSQTSLAGGMTTLPGSLMPESGRPVMNKLVMIIEAVKKNMVIHRDDESKPKVREVMLVV